jgi:ribonuclease HI
MSNEIISLYADGGVIRKNPSPYGGTWAFCGVNAAGERVIEHGGVVPVKDTAHPITNNQTEQIAIVRALEAMPDGWSGTLHSDSFVALSRVFENASVRNLPKSIQMRTHAAKARLGKVDWVLLKGHPNKEQLIAGQAPSSSGRRMLPVSEHQVWCDEECGRQADAFMDKQRVIVPGEVDWSKVRGLSLTRPWPFAFQYGKRVENRSWAPPKNHIGQWIALHAAKSWSDDDRRYIAERLHRYVPEEPPGNIFALARLVGFVKSEDDSRLPASQHQWFFGPYGWLLDGYWEVSPVTTRIECPGAQGLWGFDHPKRAGALVKLRECWEGRLRV